MTAAAAAAASVYLVSGIRNVFQVESCLLEALCRGTVEISWTQRRLISTHVCRILIHNNNWSKNSDKGRITGANFSRGQLNVTPSSLEHCRSRILMPLLRTEWSLLLHTLQQKQRLATLFNWLNNRNITPSRKGWDPRTATAFTAYELFQPCARNDFAKHGFHYSVLPMWNSILQKPSLAVFKCRLNNHFSCWPCLVET